MRGDLIIRKRTSELKGEHGRRLVDDTSLNTDDLSRNNRRVHSMLFWPFRFFISPSGRWTPIPPRQASHTSSTSGTYVFGHEVTLTSNSYGAAHAILHWKSPIRCIHHASIRLHTHSWSTSSDFTHAPGTGCLPSPAPHSSTQAATLSMNHDRRQA